MTAAGMFYKPRFPHRCWAFLRGHAWIPCPICKNRFGGHERAVGNELWITERDSVAVCPCCVDEAHAKNKENGYPRMERLPPETSSGAQPTSSS